MTQSNLTQLNTSGSLIHLCNTAGTNLKKYLNHLEIELATMIQSLELLLEFPPVVQNVAIKSLNVPFEYESFSELLGSVRELHQIISETNSQIAN